METVHGLQLNSVWSSEHHAVLIRIDLNSASEETSQRTIRWRARTDWQVISLDLAAPTWDSILIGDLYHSVSAFNDTLLTY